MVATFKIGSEMGPLLRSFLTQKWWLYLFGRVPKNASKTTSIFHRFWGSNWRSKWSHFGPRWCQTRSSKKNSKSIRSRDPFWTVLGSILDIFFIKFESRFECFLLWFTGHVWLHAKAALGKTWPPWGSYSIFLHLRWVRFPVRHCAFSGYHFEWCRHNTYWQTCRMNTNLPTGKRNTDGICQRLARMLQERNMHWENKERSKKMLCETRLHV